MTHLRVERISTEVKELFSGIFSAEERHYALNICPRHRADFGIRWRTRKTLCTVPGELAVHKSKNARGSHRVDSRQSEYIYKNSDTLIQVGSRKLTLATVSQLTQNITYY